MTTTNLYTLAQASHSEPLHAEGLTTQAGCKAKPNPNLPGED